MDDLISRTWLLAEYDKRHKGPPGGARKLIEEAPSAESESFEWCTDCKEYDTEKHCCHRFTKVIRDTVAELKLVHCYECQYSEYDSIYGDRYCHFNGKAEVVDDYHFCRDGEKGEDEPSQLARDIARIVENEKDMRVIAQPEIIRCKDCKHWIPYDWMFSEVWQSRNIDDYPEDEIGCNWSDMAMKANDFCSRGERRTE